jgi:multimeric flavodoxin WrbA
MDLRIPGGPDRILGRAMSFIQTLPASAIREKQGLPAIQEGEEMKVVAFNCSARKDGNTAILLNTVIAELSKEGIETELVQMAGQSIQGCIACYKCFKKKDGTCAVEKDLFNECFQKIKDADGILLGSPTYFADVSSSMRALIERAGFVSRANNYLLKGKVGAGVVAVRRAGSIQALTSLNLFFLYNQMVVPGSSYWNMAIGMNPGDVQKDNEGMQTMVDLGKNMAWLMNKLNA